MAKFVIHKRGFFYTDEAYELSEDAKGSIVGIFDNFEDARNEKENQDIASIQNLGGESIVDFFFYSQNYEEVQKQLENLYKTEFNLTIPDPNFFDFPGNLSKEQARKLLDILKVSFHDIVEYENNVKLNPKKFNLDNYDLQEF